MSDNAHVDRIRASGLFDTAYYRTTYGHWIPEGEDPLRHFLETGLDRGYLPSADFDPVLYKMLVPECGSDNPLLHCLASGVPFRPPPLRELFPDAAAAMSLKGNPREEPHVGRSHDYAAHAANAGELPFIADGHRYALKIPPPGTFLDRLRIDQPFAYVRLPHGFWDALWMLDVAEACIASDARGRDLVAMQRRALAIRLCGSLHATHGAFAPSFIDEVLADLPVHAGHPDFFRAVSFKGYPTFDEDVFGNRTVPPRDAVGRIFARYFRPEETLYDGTLWKRLLIAGHLGELPELCRNRPVVLIASKPFSQLDVRWQLDDFTFIPIPMRLTQWQRQDLLARTSSVVAAACARSNRPPIVLTRCGGSLAQWVITRLFIEHPKVFYLDVGQALGGWYFDALEPSGAAWSRVYAYSVVTNCHLESYYRARMGARYTEWLDALFRTGLTNAPVVESGPGGVTQGEGSKQKIISTQVLVEAIKASRPGLFDVSVTEKTAGALLMQAFDLIQERLNEVQEGEFMITGLGTFRVRCVERGEGDERVTRKVINLRLK